MLWWNIQPTKICEDLDCENDQMCSCSMCVCCSACSALCECQMATRDPNQKMADILGFGDSAYRWILLINWDTSIVKLQLSWLCFPQKNNINNKNNKKKTKIKRVVWCDRGPQAPCLFRYTKLHVTLISMSPGGMNTHMWGGEEHKHR